MSRTQVFLDGMAWGSIVMYAILMLLGSFWVRGSTRLEQGCAKLLVLIPALFALYLVLRTVANLREYL